MAGPTTPVDLAERVAAIARGLGIETVLIGAYALAAHNYVRGTADIDLAAVVALDELQRLQHAVQVVGLATKLRLPDDEDPLGGCLAVWEHADEDGDPLEPVEVVNFRNPHHPRPTPARDAIAHAIPLAGKPTLRYPQLRHLIALKLYAGAPRDHADVIELLVQNPEADRAELQSTCKQYGFAIIDDLIRQAEVESRRR